MKIKLFAALMLFSTILIFAQTNFDRGFAKGYEEGVCYGKSVGCLPGITPTAPLPKIGESSDSFTDGYNKGFVVGKAKSDGANRQNENRPSNDRPRYRAESVEHVERPIYNPSGSLLDLQIANALQLRDMKGQILQLISDGDYQQAMNLTNNGISRAPRDGEFIVLKAQVYRSAGQLQDALVWYRKCARIRCVDGINRAIDSVLDEINIQENNIQQNYDNYRQVINFDSPEQEKRAKDYYNSLPTYTGTIKVGQGAVTNKPSWGDGEETISIPDNSEVEIVSRLNEMFYKVKAGKKTGYIWALHVHK